MSRILLLLPSATYRATDFLAAAARLEVEVVVGSERRQAMAASMGDRAVLVPMDDVNASAELIAKIHERARLDAVIAVDDQGAEAAAAASERLGLPHNPPDAVAATRDKGVMRMRLAEGSVLQPDFRVVDAGRDVVSAADAVGYPCVLKPVGRSGSQGVIRADDPSHALTAARRIRRMLGACPEPLLVERFVPGDEVALEGLVRAGRLEVLAVFDKPDPLEGPYFEETIYVTPSKKPVTVLEGVAETARAACRALGVREGPVHAEMRIGPTGDVAVIEVAARSIGGLCARALRFGAGISLEEVIVRHALRLDVEDLVREAEASGVMMLPIRAAGVLEDVKGLGAARAVEGVAGVEITIAKGRPVVPLPEGDRYLGFLFARGPDPDVVAERLRRAEHCLEVVVRGPHQ